jgi:hypothetical protein
MKPLVVVALATLLVSPLAAQEPQLPSAGAPVIRFSGELGSFGELYNRKGAPGRRPGGTGRVYVNGSTVLFGSVTMGVDFLVSTEDGADYSAGYTAIPGRQQIRQFGLHPQWSWGRAHVGAFNSSYTSLTYNAIQLTGAAFDLEPGRFRVGAFGGRAARTVPGGASTGSFKRTIAGGRLGIGRQPLGRPGTYLDLMVVRAWDDPNSLPVDTTLPPNAPTAGGPVPVNPYAVTPEENLVVGAAGGLSFLEGLLAWRGEVAGAVHTRDRRASELDVDQADIPGILRGVITPRVGTHADYAYSTELQVRVAQLPGATPQRPRSLTASLGYRYAGPGYTSLGVASLGNDFRIVEGRANVRFSRWSAQFQAAGQNDNLLGQKLHTTRRHRAAGTFALRVSRVWNATLRASVLGMGNGSSDTLQWMDYNSWSIGTGHAFSFGPRRRVESMSLDYNYQDAWDANPRRTSTSFTAHSANVQLTVRLSPVLRVTPSAGLTHSRSDTAAWVSRATYGAAAAWRLQNGRVTATGSLRRSIYGPRNMWIGTLASRVAVTSQDELVLQLQVNRFRDTATPSNWFNEQVLSLRWARRF